MTLKDKISNIMAIVAFVYGLLEVAMKVWNDYLAANPDPTAAINWPMVLGALVVAVIGYLTGKSGNLKGSAPQ